MKNAFQKKAVGVNAVDDQGRSYLYRAVVGRNYQSVEALIDEKANLDQPANNKYSPLHEAIFANDLKLVNMLLRAGADPNGFSRDVPSPLMLSMAAKVDYEIFEALLNARADVHVSEKENGYQAAHFWAAISKGDKRRFVALMQAGADFAKETDMGKATPIHIAAIVNDVEAMKTLLHHGASLFVKDKDDGTPLHYAAINGALDSIDFIIAHLSHMPANDCLQTNKSKHTPVMSAVCAGQYEALQKLIKAGFDVNTPDKNRISPIMQSTQLEDDHIFKALYLAGADLNKAERVMDEYETALIWAVKKKHYDIVRIMAAEGVNMESSKKGTHTPLLEAIENMDEKMVNILVDSGVSLNYFGLSKRHRPIDMVVTEYKEENKDVAVRILQKLLKSGARADFGGEAAYYTPVHGAISRNLHEIIDVFISFPETLAVRNPTTTYTALLHAVAYNRAALLDKFIAAGSKLCEKDIKGRTAFMIGLKYKNFKLADDIYKKGDFDINYQNTEGKTALMEAVKDGCPERVNHIVDYYQGHDISLRDKEEESLLHMASYQKKPVVFNRIRGLYKDLNADIQSKVGNTPLHEAARGGNLYATDRLLMIGADPNIKNKAGLTPLTMAVAQNHADIVKRLIKADALVDYKNPDGETLIHTASRLGHTETLKILLHQKISVNVTNVNGETPLHQAIKSEKCDAVRVLIESGANVFSPNAQGQSPYQLAQTKNNDNIKQIIEGAVSKHKKPKNAAIPKGV